MKRLWRNSFENLIPMFLDEAKLDSSKTTPLLDLIWDTGSDILNTIEVYSSALTFALEQYRTSGINRYMSI